MEECTGAMQSMILANPTQTSLLISSEEKIKNKPLPELVPSKVTSFGPPSPPSHIFLHFLFSLSLSLSFRHPSSFLVLALCFLFRIFNCYQVILTPLISFSSSYTLSNCNHLLRLVPAFWNPDVSLTYFDPPSHPAQVFSLEEHHHPSFISSPFLSFSHLSILNLPLFFSLPLFPLS